MSSFVLGTWVIDMNKISALVEFIFWLEERNDKQVHQSKAYKQANFRMLL